MKVEAHVSLRRGGRAHWEQNIHSTKPIVETVSSEDLSDFSKTKTQAATACIYCGSKEPNRTREHVVAYALGGDVTIPAASCGQCQKITHKFETNVLRGPMQMVRFIQSMPSRTKHKDAPQTVPLTITVKGTKREIEVPVKEAPILLAFPTFDEPTYLVGGDPRLKLTGTVTGSFGVDPDEFAKKMNAEELQIMSSEYSPVAFAQMVAKIAYANAFIQGQLERVEDVAPLLHAMLENPNEIGRFVGTMHEPYIRRDGVTHYLGIHELLSEKVLYATVQLFASTGAPIYVVVLGRLRDTATQQGTASPRVNAGVGRHSEAL